MAVKVGVLVEFRRRWANAFGRHAAAVASETEALRQAESLVRRLSGVGLDPSPRRAPVPLFSPQAVFGAPDRPGFSAFAALRANPDVAADSVVVACEVDPGRLEALRAGAPRVRVWPDSPLTLYRPGEPAGGADGPRGGGGGPDCPPFRPGSTVEAVRDLLAVAPLWRQGPRGRGVVVGLLGEGVHGGTYPVADGGPRVAGAPPPGGAPAAGHGSTCAAGVLIAAPAAALYDYPFPGAPTSGGALGLLQAVLDRRRLDGTPHLTCHGYGLAAVPPRDASPPGHEAWSPDHPLHRKLREVVASGAACLFGAGDCGAPCPSPRCEAGGIGPGRSIHGPNALAEVITVAAVNGRRERIGYSAQGPGPFDGRKPDVSAYAHVLGHFGPGRPGGTRVAPFDGGSAVAAAVAAGVGALLLGAFPGVVTPGLLKEALTRGAVPPAGADGGGGGAVGWNPDTGHGVVNAEAAYDWLRTALASS